MTPNTSRAATPMGDLEAFDPARPSVSPSDSVLLPTGKVPGYLDMALKALALHTEARTSFITYAFSLPPIP
jgi:ubiquitin C